MDPTSVIMAALIAGTTAGISQGMGNLVNQALVDAYNALKKLLVGKSTKPKETQKLIKKHEADQEKWGDKVRDNIVECELDKSEEILREAEKVLTILIESKKNLQNTDLPKLVGQLNAYGGKVIIVGGNVNQIDM